MGFEYVEKNRTKELIIRSVAIEVPRSNLKGHLPLKWLEMQ